MALEDTLAAKQGYKIPANERKAIELTGGSPAYGELLYSGVSQLLSYLQLDDSSTFVDLGSGTGRVLLQVALNSNVRRAIGLELSPTRMEYAELALRALREAGAPLAPVELRLADLASCDLEEGSHFYLCSTAFSASLCRSIAERLSASRNFRVLMVTRQLPPQPFLRLLGDLECDNSWSPRGRIYVYAKSVSQAPVPLLTRLYCRDGMCWLPPGEAWGTLPSALHAMEDMDLASRLEFVNMPHGGE